MCKYFYNLLISPRINHMDLFDYLEMAERYGKIHTDVNEVVDVDGNLTVPYSEEPLFIAAKDESEAYVVFYKDLFILFSINNELDDKIVQIYVKRPEDEWRIPVKQGGGEFDLLNPCNVKVEVYIKYDVSVTKLNRRITRCSGDEYKSGNWNKTFYQSLNSFIKNVEGYTEISQIKHAYSK